MVVDSGSSRLGFTDGLPRVTKLWTYKVSLVDHHHKSRICVRIVLLLPRPEKCIEFRR